MENKVVKLGIIGLGNMGSGHAKSIVGGATPEIRLVAAADIDPAKLEKAKEYLPETVKLFSTAEEMLDSGLIDAAIVAIPHYDHPKYVIACLEKGIHVMCEKPAGVYTKQVREMNAVAAAHPETVFAMMFNQRTNHIYRKMRELVQSGKYGQIRRTNWLITTWFRPQAYYDSGAWRASWSGEGGGVLLNQCPHQLDLWQWICGMPVKVSSQLHYGKWHDIEVEDDVTTYVEYANGATGVFVTSTGDICGTNRFEIQLEKAKIVAEEDRIWVWEYEMSEPEFDKVNTKAWNSPKVTEIQVETDGKNPQHVGVLNAFAANILRGEPLVARGEEGINGLTVSNAMHLSSWLGRPVELPFDEDLYYDLLKEKIASSRRKG
ncbi:MAG: Gfo/Idh/MocA family oxidoreductase [Ruminococcaceae bacterium]|nr:Gfo/Idh/MocA family oxidoreductase [Oscillospiraceae bacterium]